MKELVINIYEASEGGFMYDIYLSQEDFANDKSVDGGHCTTTLENALDMAHSQAKDLTYYSDKLQKTVILDWDVNGSFDSNEELAEALIRYHNESIDLERKIS